MSSRIAVLVVEDEPLIRMDLVDDLTERGFEVFEASNASQAIQILKENSAVQILFTDVEMPGSMDGVMLAAAVRDRWPPIQIVVTSGNRLINPSELPSNSRFFTKPCNVEMLASAFREMAA